MCQAHLKMKQIVPPLCSSQVPHLVFEASFHSPLQLDGTNLGGNLDSASRLHVEVKLLAS
jgi:hypothetical protein